MKAYFGDRARLIAAVSAVLGLSLAACASDQGEEWQAITAEQFDVTLAAPGLEDQRVRYLRGRSKSRRARVELAVWSGPDSHHPKAAVTHVKTTPGFHFRSRRDPKRHIGNSKSFADLELSFDSVVRDSNRQGRIDYRRFRGPGLDCLVFAQYWGSSGGDGVVEGATRLLRGHYCATPGEALTDATVTGVVKGLVIKR